MQEPLSITQVLQQALGSRAVHLQSSMGGGIMVELQL